MKRVLVAIGLVGGLAPACGDDGRVASPITEIELARDAAPYGIAPAPDGTLWFTEQVGRIGHLDPASGAVSELAVPTANAIPYHVAIETATGAVWFTEKAGNQLARLDPVSGAIEELALPEADSEPAGLAEDIAGGGMWFVEDDGDRIGHVTSAQRAITELALPSAASAPYGIAVRGDSVWITESALGAIAELDAQGHVTSHVVPTAGADVRQLAIADDGSVWFTEFERGNAIGRYVPADDTFAEFPLARADAQPFDIARGPDGAMWFTEKLGNQIGRIAPDGTITEIPIGTPGAQPARIAAGADAMWFTEYASGRLGRVPLD